MSNINPIVSAFIKDFKSISKILPDYITKEVTEILKSSLPNLSPSSTSKIAPEFSLIHTTCQRLSHYCQELSQKYRFISSPPSFLHPPTSIDTTKSQVLAYSFRANGLLVRLDQSSLIIYPERNGLTLSDETAKFGVFLPARPPPSPINLKDSEILQYRSFLQHETYSELNILSSIKCLGNNQYHRHLLDFYSSIYSITFPELSPNEIVMIQKNLTFDSIKQVVRMKTKDQLESLYDVFCQKTCLLLKWNVSLVLDSLDSQDIHEGREVEGRGVGVILTQVKKEMEKMYEDYIDAMMNKVKSEFTDLFHSLSFIFDTSMILNTKKNVKEFKFDPTPEETMSRVLKIMKYEKKNKKIFETSSQSEEADTQAQEVRSKCEEQYAAIQIMIAKWIGCKFQGKILTFGHEIAFKEAMINHWGLKTDEWYIQLIKPIKETLEIQRREVEIEKKKAERCMRWIQGWAKVWVRLNSGEEVDLEDLKRERAKSNDTATEEEAINNKVEDREKQRILREREMQKEKERNSQMERQRQKLREIDRQKDKEREREKQILKKAEDEKQRKAEAELKERGRAEAENKRILAKTKELEKQKEKEIAKVKKQQEKERIQMIKEKEKQRKLNEEEQMLRIQEETLKKQQEKEKQIQIQIEKEDFERAKLKQKQEETLQQMDTDVLIPSSPSASLSPSPTQPASDQQDMHEEIIFTATQDEPILGIGTPDEKKEEKKEENWDVIASQLASQENLSGTKRKRGEEEEELKTNNKDDKKDKNEKNKKNKPKTKKIKFSDEVTKDKDSDRDKNSEELIISDDEVVELSSPGVKQQQQKSQINESADEIMPFTQLHENDKPRKKKEFGEINFTKSTSSPPSLSTPSLTTTISSLLTSTSSPAANPKYIVTGMNFTTQDRQLTKSLDKLLEYSEKWIVETTHLVVPASWKRTEKIYLAMSKGAWVVTIDWIKKIKEEGALVNEEEYEFKDFLGIKKGRERKNKGIQVFEGKKFFLRAPFVLIGRSSLVQIIRNMGGKILHSLDSEKGVKYLVCEKKGEKKGEEEELGVVYVTVRDLLNGLETGSFAKVFG